MASAQPGGNLTDLGTITRREEPTGSSFSCHRAEDHRVRLHRIELLTNTMTVDLPFHHQTTVVAGLDRLEAEALALEIVAALEIGRAGLSADISTQTGRRLEIRRPLDRPAFVTDIDTSIDATPSLTVNGTVQPLAALGITAPVRVTNADLLVAEQANDRVQQLARLDQDQLWGLAISLAELEVEAARQTDDEVVSEPISLDASTRIEQARADVELAQQRLAELSDQWIVAAGSLALISLAVAFITHPLMALPFVFAALGVAWRARDCHKTHEAAISTELVVLEEFGLESYLDFQLRKVDALTSDGKRRRRGLLLAEKRRFALDAWQRLVGTNVSLDWAAAHRPTITIAAKQTAKTVSDADATSEAVSLALAHRIQQATGQAEPSPLIVDDIFSQQSDAAVERLLWLIDHHCQQLQFVVLSSDARVLQWAAQRTIARHASILRLTDRADGDAIALEGEASEAETVASHPAETQTASIDQFQS